MDWYVVQASFNSCRLEKEGPASTIELSQKFLKKTPETFDEKTIGGVVVNVKVKFGNGFVEYIRGKERCEETLKARAGEKKEELDSYKNKYK